MVFLKESEFEFIPIVSKLGLTKENFYLGDSLMVFFPMHRGFKFFLQDHERLYRYFIKVKECPEELTTSKEWRKNFYMLHFGTYTSFLHTFENIYSLSMRDYNSPNVESTTTFLYCKTLIESIIHNPFNFPMRLALLKQLTELLSEFEELRTGKLGQDDFGKGVFMYLNKFIQIGSPVINDFFTFLDYRIVFKQKIYFELGQKEEDVHNLRYVLDKSDDQIAAYITIPGFESDPFIPIRTTSEVSPVMFNLEQREIYKRFLYDEIISSVYLLPQELNNVNKHIFEIYKAGDKVTLASFAFTRFTSIMMKSRQK